MNQYILLLRVLFLFYLIVVAIVVIGTGPWFMDTPMWFTYLKLVVALVNMIVIHKFIQAINILRDED